ncbi:MAG TPA: hypothetical protein VMW65_01670, partial [Chloroflexota bacterium]|nr:hypothetical protein [Chloroflexota bacterium]
MINSTRRGSPTVLYYLSEVIGARVKSPSGAPLGSLKDLIVQVGSEPFPRVNGFLVIVGGIT